MKERICNKVWMGYVMKYGGSNNEEVCKLNVNEEE